jgi:hypothetical protein
VARLRALVAGALALAVSSAAADPIALPDTRATLTVDRGWTSLPVSPRLVVAYKGPGGAVLAVTRAQVSNPDAWRAKTREAYLEQVERGIAASIRGYRRIAKRTGDLHDVPFLDVEARRDDGATIVVRMLLFRTYALGLAIEVPKGTDAVGARAIAQSFGPPKS